jgi:integrase
VLAVLPEYLKDFSEWAYATGMRKGEASLLRWDMIEGDELRIPGNIAKNREARTLPLCGDLKKIIERRKTARTVNEKGRARMVDLIFHLNGHQITDFRKSWRTSCKKAGVAGILFHDLRRSAVRNLTQAGVPQAVAMRVSGHQTPSVFSRYNIVVTDDVRTALERTDQYRVTAAKHEEQKVVSMG